MYDVGVLLKTDKETRDNLLRCAKQEFLEKDYMQASLRNICKNAGVTTGALYFFFQDKEDLFANLVQEPLNRLYQIMLKHYNEEMEYPPEMLNRLEEVGDDIDAAKRVIHFMYQNLEEFQLLLIKSKGSRFENCIDQFVEITEKHYRRMADQMCEYMHVPRLDDYMIHWLSHMHIDIFVHMLTHEQSEEEALKHIEVIVKYLISGWIRMFQKE